MNTKHADPPNVCSECLGALFDSIAGGGDRITFLHCAHRGHGTLVRIQLTAGAITNWRLSAPISQAEAERQITEHGELLRAAGLVPPDRGRLS